MKETQKSVTVWANESFGVAPTLGRQAARANKEMAELIATATLPGADPADVLEEAADVVIVLYRLADMCGGDLLEAIDRKMEINRARKWKLDGAGHGYHVHGAE